VPVGLGGALFHVTMGCDSCVHRDLRLLLMFHLFLAVARIAAMTWWEGS
jgi:hypothetical protein